MKRAPNGEETYYAGSFIYKGANLEYILHAEAKYQVSEEDGGYQYHLKDHLGNVRMVVKGDETKQVLDQTDYYPFGMSMNMALNPAGQRNLYKYNGKELQDDAIGNGELDWYDYGARMYDPAIGRFHTVDPMAEEPHNISLTSYHYCNNNPILFIDVNGEDWFVNSSTGTVMYLSGISEITNEVVEQVYQSLFDQSEAQGVDYASMFTDEGGLDNWQNFGEDAMFDTDDNKISKGGNQLLFGEAGESFMNDHGFEKAAKQDVEEHSITQMSTDWNGTRSDELFRKRYSNTEITYVPHNNYFEGPKKLTETRGFQINLTTTRYTQTVPWNQRGVSPRYNWVDGKGQEALNHGLKSFNSLLKWLKRTN